MMTQVWTKGRWMAKLMIPLGISGGICENGLGEEFESFL
jgi:hypothetical protein